MLELDKLVTITLDKERHLRLTLKGMLEFEKHTGKNLMKGFKLDGLSMDDSAAMIWACLIHEDKELIYDDVLYMVDLSNITFVMLAVSECIEKSLQEAGEVSERPLVKKSRPG